MNAAVRSGTFFSSVIRQMVSKALTMICSRRSLISPSVQKKLENSCTYSKLETVTPPALATTSGTTRMSQSVRMSSAAGVAGPFAASTTILARTGGTQLGELAFQCGRHEILGFQRSEGFDID